MFSLKNKLEPNLRYCLDNKLYKVYRVNIFCRTLQENVEKKIKSYKCSLLHSIPSAGVISAMLTPNAIERLLEFPEIDHIIMDSYAFLCGTSVLSANGISFQEKYKLTGKGIGIGLVDTGIYPHPDLLSPFNKIKGFLDLINGYKYPYDDNGHGTFIAGIISASGIHSKSMYKGIAEGSSLHCVKAFNAIGRGYISDILYAISYLLINSKESNIRVLCLPFEVMEHNKYTLEAFSKLFNIALDKGIIPVVPAGNNENWEGSVRGIAGLSNCITVGGVDTKSTLSPYKYSSAGPCGKQDKPDLSAACVEICSLNSNTNFIPERNGIKLFSTPLEKPYVTYTGTSCAAAYIAGICSLLFENNSQLAFKDILALMKLSCTMGSFSKWLQGSGTIDIHKLLP